MKQMLICILSVCVFQFHCSTESPVAGPSTELENPAFVGVVVDSLRTPSIGAHISIFKIIDINTSPDNQDTMGVEILTLKTDSKGNFKLDNMSSGEYLIKSISSDSSLTALKRILFKSDLETTVFDTLILGTPGILKGVISRDGISQNNAATNDGDIRLVLVEINQSTITGPKGDFTLKNIPEGVYSLAIYPGENFFSEIRKSIFVSAGKVTVIDTIHLQRIPWVRPPKPNNLRCVYDTVSASVTLRWNSVNIGNLRGYVIERREKESILVPSEIFVSDTVYQESLASYAAGTTLYYSVKSYTIQFEKSYPEGPVEIIISK